MTKEKFYLKGNFPFLTGNVTKGDEKEEEKKVKFSHPHSVAKETDKTFHSSPKKSAITENAEKNASLINLILYKIKWKNERQRNNTA